MRFDLDDVIVAPATASGPGLRSIVRLSGTQSLELARQVFCPHDLATWPPQRASMLHGSLQLGHDALLIDAWACVWPDHRSFTRQPIVELHLEAGPLRIERLIQQLVQAGARPAERGEFTLRAFLGGRIDLTQAEAVLGIIDARSSRELTAGLEQLAGGLAQPLIRLREDLLCLLADLEAGLDFVDEGIEFIDAASVVAQLKVAREQLRQLSRRLDDRDSAVRLPRVALIGPPNAGKSTLFNALLNQDQALVSDQPGTTRDHLEQVWRWDKGSCVLLDTAGLGRLVRSGSKTPSSQSDQAIISVRGLPTGIATHDWALDSIDRAAQEQTIRALANCDLTLLCLPFEVWNELEESTWRAWMDWLEFPADKLLCVETQIDRSNSVEEVAAGNPSLQRLRWRVSAAQGLGVERLAAAIQEQLASRLAGVGGVESTSQRCRASLEGAERALAEAQQGAAESWGDELVAASLRLALGELGTVTGEVATEDLLDRVFARFCIGK